LANAVLRGTVMTIDRMLRGIAGFFILVSVALAYFHSLYWLLFTAFVGLNLFQSSFTNWCPMMNILKALGLKSGGQS
jgi:glucan phosphoethanolaminetransferase (alkaline phosphatase superfamily)